MATSKQKAAEDAAKEALLKGTEITSSEQGVAQEDKAQSFDEEPEVPTFGKQAPPIETPAVDPHKKVFNSQKAAREEITLATNEYLSRLANAKLRNAIAPNGRVEFKNALNELYRVVNLHLTDYK